MPVLVAFRHLTLSDRYRLVACTAHIRVQFVVTVGAVDVLVFFRIGFSMKLFVALPTAEVFLVPCLPLCLCEGVSKDQL